MIPLHVSFFLLLFSNVGSWKIIPTKSKSVRMKPYNSDNIKMIDDKSLSFKRVIIPSFMSFSIFSNTLMQVNMPAKAMDTSEIIITSSETASTTYSSPSSTSIFLAGNVEEDVPGFSVAFDNVLRVRYSLPQIAAEIEKSSDASPVVKEIKLLLTNYKLKDNVNKSLDTMKNSNRKFNINFNDARSHGTSAVEYLSTIFEYFEEDIDNATGKKAPKPEVLGLAYKAIGAATEELDKFIVSIPEEIKGPSIVQVKSEFNY